jgi:carbon-monoxide dehydrogenase medium subunit
MQEGGDGSLSIGAAVPLAELETHPVVLRGFPILAECSRTIGAWPLRNRATAGGNLCNASPAADMAVALLALEAIVTATGPLGTRTIPVTELFLGPGQTALAPGELLTEIVLPAHAARWEGRYLRLSRRKGMDLATVGALVARSTGNGWRHYRVALAAVAPTPMRVPSAEALLDREGIGAAPEAGALARDACRPISDIRGSAEYRREMVGVLVTRGLLALC